MDYTAQPVAFRLKKALRYIRLYGIRRTFAKIRSQQHLKRRYAAFPAMKVPPRDGAHVGVLGCGNFAFSTLAHFLRANYGNVIHAAMDFDLHRAASLYEHYAANYYTNNAVRVISDPAIDLVFVASNHASHADYAIGALELGKSVHIEKPHAVNEDQLVRLCQAMSRSTGKVTLGFNRPGSRLGREIQRHLDSQSGPTICNWFIAGHEIPPDHWYCREEEGGRVLGNLCHWTDFVYRAIAPEGRYPITIRPTRAAQADCDVAVSYTFGDGSIATITFAAFPASGHSFEGVRERFTALRGNALVSLEDFQHLTVEVLDKKFSTNLRHRDHGHEATVRASYEMVRGGPAPNAGSPVSYVWETGQLFLRTRQALEENRIITLEGFETSFPRQKEGHVPGPAEHSRRPSEYRKCA